MESKIQFKILREIASRGGFAFKVIKANRNGIPDVVAIYKGMAILVEVKDKDGRVSEVQRRQIARARDAGAYALVARTVGDVTDIMDKIDEKD